MYLSGFPGFIILESVRRSSKFFFQLNLKILLQAWFFFFIYFSPELFAREIHLTILFTNDHHGQVEPIHAEDPSEPIGGVTRRMSVIQKIRQEVRPSMVLLVDGGDVFTGTALSGLTQGEVDCVAYRLMGYDAVVLGDHDFDYGKKVLLDYRKHLGMPWISANIVVRANSQNFVRPYVIKYAGVRVGLIGFSHPETPSLTRRENVAGLIFNPPGAAAKGLYSILKKDADIFVALTHLGVEEDKKFAKDNPFFHVIVGGHSLTLLQEPLVEKRKDGSLAGPLIVQAGSQGLYLGRLDITVTGNKKGGFRVTDYHYQLVPITANLPEDSRMLALLEKYKKTLKAESLDEVLTTVTGDFSKSTDGNCLLGQMAADAMKESVQTDVALLNSDAFRSNFRSGSLTREILYEIYPFDDELITMEVRGDLLKRILEKSFQRKGQGSFLQVSGLKIVPSGGQLRIMVGREPLQSRRKYKVALNDFLAEGGDGYDELRGVKSKETSSQTVRSILEKALKAKPEISAVDPEKRWN